MRLILAVIADPVAVLDRLQRGQLKMLKMKHDQYDQEIRARRESVGRLRELLQTESAGYSLDQVKLAEVLRSMQRADVPLDSCVIHVLRGFGFKTPSDLLVAAPPRSPSVVEVWTDVDVCECNILIEFGTSDRDWMKSDEIVLLSFQVETTPFLTRFVPACSSWSIASWISASATLPP